MVLFTLGWYLPREVGTVRVGDVARICPTVAPARTSPPAFRTFSPDCGLVCSPRGARRRR
jgi:hypothetical protein